MLRRGLAAFISLQEHEVSPALHAFASMFCLLASYFVVVPLREEAGISLGTDTLPKLFTASLVGVLLVTPLTSILLSRPGIPKEHLLRQLYIIVATVMLAFYVLYYSSVLHGSSFSPSPAAATLGPSRLQSPPPLLASSAPLGVTSPLQHSETGGSQPKSVAESGAAQSLTAASSSVGDSGALAAVPTGNAPVGGQSPTWMNVFAHKSRRQLLSGATSANGPQQPDSAQSVSAGSMGSAAAQGQAAASQASGTAEAGSGGLRGGAEAGESARAGAHQQPGDRGREMLEAALILKKGEPSLGVFQRAVRCAFFVWLNVQNLVALSSMWARCADVFSAEAARRLFGFIASGATLGQLAGSLTSMAITGGLGRHGLTLSSLIFISSMLIYATAWLSTRVTGSTPSSSSSSSSASSTPSSSAVMGNAGSSAAAAAAGGQPGSGLAATSRQAAGGPAGKERLRLRVMGSVRRALEGWYLIAASRFLLLLCGYLMFTYAVGSLMYFQRSLLVAGMVRDSSQRAAFFARINSMSAALIFALQLVATGRLLKYLGVTASLSLYPLVCLLSLYGLTAYPSASNMALAEVARKLLGYSLVRPAREVLFTVLSREEKYSAKMVIDAVIQRLGDTLAAACFEVLDVRLRLGVGGVAWAGAVACLLWFGTSLQLGTTYHRLARGSTVGPSVPHH